MAVRKTLDFKGITGICAYIRVSGVTILAGNTLMQFRVNSMVEPDMEPFDSVEESCSYLLEGGNPVRQAYDHLKTLEKYAGAEDC